MAIRFAFVDAVGEIQGRGPFLSDALREFLITLRLYVDTNLAIIAGLDPHDDDVFDGVQALALADSAARLRNELSTREWGDLPPLPPHLDEDVVEKAPMTREQVLSFLDALASMGEMARDRGLSIAARGD
jgi:hypothetical protein